MAKTKRTKLSKTPTTKGMDLPESVEWLLGFFNIKSIPGEYNPRKLLFAKKPKRTPTKPPENPETGYVKDHKGYAWVPSFDNEPECIGKETFYPTSSDFRKYFESCKIRNASIVKGDDMYQKIKWLWDDLSMAFARLVTANQPIDTDRLLSKGVVIDIKEQQEIGQSVIRSHCQSYLDNYDLETQLRISRGDWLPDIKGIPDVIYIKLLTWLNYEELHKRLRQCPCCGTFWIQEKKRGRPSDFCNKKKCGNVINYWTRKKKVKRRRNIENIKE